VRMYEGEIRMEADIQIAEEVVARMEMIQRYCLKCGLRFTAMGRFNRICNRCKGTDAWRCSRTKYELISASTRRHPQGATDHGDN